MKVLFVCNQNKHRSKTAEAMFSSDFETRSAGLYSEKPLTKKQLSWADLVVVMEDAQREEIAKRFPSEYMQKKILSLNIPDIYNYNQMELKSILDSKMKNLPIH